MSRKQKNLSILKIQNGHYPINIQDIYEYTYIQIFRVLNSRKFSICIFKSFDEYLPRYIQQYEKILISKNQKWPPSRKYSTDISE